MLTRTRCRRHSISCLADTGGNRKRRPDSYRDCSPAVLCSRTCSDRECTGRRLPHTRPAQRRCPSKPRAEAQTAQWSSSSPNDHAFSRSAQAPSVSTLCFSVLAGRRYAAPSRSLRMSAVTPACAGCELEISMDRAVRLPPYMSAWARGSAPRARSRAVRFGAFRGTRCR